MANLNRTRESARTLLDRLPHREPFRFVSEVTAIESGVAASAVWIIRGDEPFFAGHFPGDPIVPGVLVAEALAQLAGLVGFADCCISQDAGLNARLASIDVKFQTSLRPPVAVMLSARVARALDGLTLFDVSANANETVAASGRLMLAATTCDGAGAP